MKSKLRKNFFVRTALLSAMLFFVFSLDAFASQVGAGTDADQYWRNLILFFATWIGRIGMVIAFIGGIMFALAFRNDDADGKSRGIQVAISGIIVYALTLSLDLFGLI